MLRLTLSLALVLVPLSASAEVCDKVAGEGWRPEDGPGGIFVDFGSTAPWFIVIAMVWALSLFSRPIAWFVATVVSCLALIVAMHWWEDHEIIQAAFREGCVNASSTILQVIGFAVLAGLFVFAPRFRSQLARAA